MESLKCEKHKISKNFVFCLEKGCEDGLACKKCCILDKKHTDHNVVMVEFFMENDEDEIKRIFDQEYIQNMKNAKNNKEFV